MYSQQQGAAQFPTLSCTIVPAACIVTAIAHCNSAQAQGVFPTVPTVCGILPPSIGCPPNTGAQAQTVFPTLPPFCGILPPSIGCHQNTGAQANAGAQAQFPTFSTSCIPTVSCPTVSSCPTVPISSCLTGVAGSAQAQFPTLSTSCIPTVSCPTVSSCPTVPISSCLPGAAGSAQAQTVIPPTMMGCSTVTTTVQPTHPQGCVGPTGTEHCPPHNAGAAQFPTLSCTIPVVCEVTAIATCTGAQAQNVGNTGWYTCGQSTVTTTVQPTHPEGCVGPTGTENCTSALGCPSTSTCPPNAGAQAQTEYTVVVCDTVQTCFPTTPDVCFGAAVNQGSTSALGCPSTSTCPPNNAGAQNVGITGWYTCGILGPTGTQGCTSALGCPNTSTCTPTNAGAQAQFPTVSCTIPVAVCAATKIAGCGGSGFPTTHCTGLPIVC